MDSAYENRIKLFLESIVCDSGMRCFFSEDADKALNNIATNHFQDNGQTILGNVRSAITKSITDHTCRKCPLENDPDTDCKASCLSNLLCIYIPLEIDLNEIIWLSVGAQLGLKENQKAVSSVTCIRLCRLNR